VAALRSQSIAVAKCNNSPDAATAAASPAFLVILLMREKSDANT
jgi:hypothetical protein